MAAATIAPPQITLEEYLHTAYHPDCDFVDGHLEERNMGGTRHGRLQMQLGHWFILHEQEWNVRVMSELRTRVSPTRIRLPDVTVAGYDAALNEEEVRTTPPLIAIEILSPDDRINRVVVRLKDFLNMGIPHVWFARSSRASWLYLYACRLETGGGAHHRHPSIAHLPGFAETLLYTRLNARQPCLDALELDVGRTMIMQITR